LAYLGLANSKKYKERTNLIRQASGAILSLAFKLINLTTLKNPVFVCKSECFLSLNAKGRTIFHIFQKTADFKTSKGTWIVCPSESNWAGLACRAGPCQAEPSRAEPSRAEPSQAKPSRAEPSQAKLSRAKPSRAEPIRAEPSRAFRPSDRPPFRRPTDRRSADPPTDLIS
jgi:hypothetical protein